MIIGKSLFDGNSEVSYRLSLFIQEPECEVAHTGSVDYCSADDVLSLLKGNR
jgi:hypothetical protein